MSTSRRWLAGAAMLAGVLCCAAAARAEAPRTPAELIPDKADLLIEVANPRRLVEALTTLDVVKELRGFPVIKEFMASTQSRRFYQLLAYFEKELGAKWPELLDRLAGDGLAIGVKFGPNPAPALLVIQGKDDKLVKKFAEIGLNLIEQELARVEAKGRPVKGTYQGVETVSIGEGFHLAVAGSAILIANKDKALQMGLDLHLGRDKASLARVASVGQAHKILPKDVLIGLWLNMNTVKALPGAKEVYTTPRDGFLAVNFGSYLDALGRSDFLAVGFEKTPDGFLTSIRIPAGREGAGVEKALHIPPDGQPGTRPLLEPKGVLYSYSFYLDFARIWEDRAKIFTDQQAKGLEKVNMDSGRIPLSGIQLSKLLTEAGAYHRIVVVNQPKVGYKKTPKTPIPAFAIVSEMRKPESFGKSMETILRGVALLTGNQAKLKLVEETYKDCKIIAYRFPEDGIFKVDVNDIRFNFSPCFVIVGNQFVACSTIELCHELVDLLQKESKSADKGSPATSRQRFYAGGIADILAITEDQLITQTMLDQAVPVEEARQQVRHFIGLLRTMGNFNIEATFGPKELHYDFRFRLKTDKEPVRIPNQDKK
jgi:hypothetical protein